MPVRSKTTSATAIMEDAGFDKFFEEVIASPELNLLSDDFEQIEPSQDAIFSPPSYPIHHHHGHHPILHRLQPVVPPHISILKSHVIPQPISAPSSGGISPTLTWDPSPTDQSNSPGLHDIEDDDFVNIGNVNLNHGCEKKASPTTWAAPLFTTGTRSSSRRNSSATRSSRSRDSSHSRSRSSCSNSISGGDDDPLAMSTLSLISASSTSTRVDHDMSPTVSTFSVKDTSDMYSPTSPPARKKARTSSRSSIDSIVMDVNGTANRLIPTGHRRNITSSSLVPIDAPTQVRHYLTPSSTSKKETPSAFIARKNKLRAKEATLKATTGRKRSRDESEEAEEDNYPLTTKEEPDELGAGDPDDLMSNEQNSLLSAIEAKRRQNTLAARRSRQRKLDYVRNLEELLGVMTRERDEWKDRAEKAEYAIGTVLDEED